MLSAKEQLAIGQAGDQFIKNDWVGMNTRGNSHAQAVVILSPWY